MKKNLIITVAGLGIFLAGLVAVSMNKKSEAPVEQPALEASMESQPSAIPGTETVPAEQSSTGNTAGQGGVNASGTN